MKYNKERAIAQINPRPLRQFKLEPGTILTLEKVVVQDNISKDGKNYPMDFITYKLDSGFKVDIRIKDLLRNFTTEEGIEIFKVDVDNVELPDVMEIVSSKNTTNYSGDILFDWSAYNYYPQFIQGQISAFTLMDSGVKEDNKLEPRQNYIVKLKN